MRRNAVTGAVVALVTVLAVWAGSGLDLRLEPFALLGAALGGAVAMVPAGAPALRLAGFAVGLLAALVGYLARAAALPDTTLGQAVSAALVVVVGTVVAVATAGRLQLWSILLGAAAFAGAYELRYLEAPPRVLTTSVETLTGLVVCVTLGFMAVTAAAPAVRRPVGEGR